MQPTIHRRPRWMFSQRGLAPDIEMPRMQRGEKRFLATRLPRQRPVEENRRRDVMQLVAAQWKTSQKNESFPHSLSFIVVRLFIRFIYQQVSDAIGFPEAVK